MSSENKKHPAIKALIKGGDVIEKILITIGAITVIGFVVTIFIDVLFRTLFTPIVWMQEISKLFYMWSIFLGSAIAFRRGVHFKIDILHFENPVIKRTLSAVSYFLCCVFVYIILYYGYTFTMAGMIKKSLPSGIPLFYFRLSFPVSGVCMLYYCIEGVLENVFGIDVKGKEA